MRTRHLFVAMGVFVAAAFGYAAVAPDRDPGIGALPTDVAATAAPTTPSASAAPAEIYDVSHLIRPEKDYVGTAINGAPRDMSRVEVYAERTGIKPNMVTIYESFDDRFAASEVRKVYQYGGLAIVRWEPFKQKLADIADGRYDEYLTEFATDVKQLNLPIALTVAHEMNGHWYSWGTQQNKPADFVAAWKHIHDLFEEVGATNVIWTWTPNVINYLRDAKLKNYWPGDKYVDWVGIDGYFTYNGDTTFETLFRPTLKEVGKFTDKPVMIVETGSEPGAMRARAVGELFAKVAAEKNIIGFVYFNARGSANWVINDDKKALDVFKKHKDRDRFGFTVK
jgi:mannan endo-1,4-beta-mannosidase